MTPKAFWRPSELPFPSQAESARAYRAWPPHTVGSNPNSSARLLDHPSGLWCSFCGIQQSTSSLAASTWILKDGATWSHGHATWAEDHSRGGHHRVLTRAISSRTVGVGPFLQPIQVVPHECNRVQFYLGRRSMGCAQQSHAGGALRALGAQPLPQCVQKV